MLLKLGYAFCTTALISGCADSRQEKAQDAVDATQRPPVFSPGGPTGGFNLKCGKQSQEYKQAGYQQHKGCVTEAAGRKIPKRRVVEPWGQSCNTK